MVIGREYEIKKLNEFYDSKEAELIALYGRRRVGKTFLIDEVFEDRITFRHSGLSPIPEVILIDFVGNQLIRNLLLVEDAASIGFIDFFF